MQCGLFLTAIGTLMLCIHGVLLSESPIPRTPGYLDFDNLPETNFTCEGKVIGGYYADIETGCQMFHVCTIGQRGDMTDIKFLCLNGTVFDQETRVCERVDEVDCSRSQDFYDLNLELYHSAGIQPEDESKPEEPKKETSSEEAEVEEEVYDENYELDTEEPPQPPQTTTKLITTTTTTTTTPKPIYTSPKPAFSIVLPNINKNTGTHLTGFAQNYNPTKNNITPKPTVSSIVPNYNENRNTGTHLTGFVPGVPSQSPRPFGVEQPATPQSQSFGNHKGPTPHHQSFGQPQHQQFGYHPPSSYPKIPPPLETGLKPPPTSYQPYSGQPTSTSFKPPGYDGYKNLYFSTSSASPPMLVEDYGHKTQQQQSTQQQPQQQDSPKRPLVVLSHHFPALPTKSSFEDFTGFSSPGATFLRYKPRQQHKPNPTILALQSQQKKVHQLHQEGLEHAEHQNAQVASRNAEISSLQSQQDETARSFETDNVGSRETKEIHGNSAVENVNPVEASNSPAIAVITSTSSTSSRVQKQPITSYVKTVTNEKGVAVSQQVYSATPEFQTELEKLFKNNPKKEENSDMDLEQLLLAWKLKTNQEVTKSDIEKVFHSLDLSKFKNGETISLTDIFMLMNATESDLTTRVPPTTYDEYTEEDVPFDPFFKDVPKVGSRSKRNSNVQVVSLIENGKFRSHTGRRRGKGQESQPITIADIEVVTGSKRGRVHSKDEESVEEHTSDVELPEEVPAQLNDRQRSGRTIKESGGEEPVRQIGDNPRKSRGRGSTKFKPYGDELPKEGSTVRPFPKTGFSCRNKIAGGFYADSEVDCQLFHICTDAGDGTLIDQPFFCGDNTRFNQRSRTCQAEELVDCKLSQKYYHLNDNFKGGAASQVTVQ